MTARQARGFALIDLIFVCGIIGILASIAIPRLLDARKSATAASAIESMRTINSAQLGYALACGNGFYAPSLTTLAKPPAGSSVGFISPDLGQADMLVKSGYTIQILAVPFAGAPDTCNTIGPGQAGQAFRAGADPLDPTVMRYFATNASGYIYEDNISLLAAMPELGEPPAGHPLQ